MQGGWAGFLDLEREDDAEGSEEESEAFEPDKQSGSDDDEDSDDDESVADSDDAVCPFLLTPPRSMHSTLSSRSSCYHYMFT